MAAGAEEDLLSTRLSVIVPSHNAAQYLPATLATARANAADDIEWVLVEDGSSDSTRAMLHAFDPGAGTVQVVEHETARGLAGARNAGMEVANGRYIAFLDADDWLGPQHLPRLADAIERLGADFVRSDHVRVEGVLRTVVRAPEGRRNVVLPAHSGIVHGRTAMVDYPYAWSAVYDVKLRDRGLLTVDPRIKTAEDRVMAWRLHLLADTYAVVSESGYFYRRAVPGSLSTIGDVRQLDFFKSFDAIGEVIAADPALAKFHQRWVRSYTAMVVHHEIQRDRLAKDVHRMFLTQARATFGALPQPELEIAIGDLDPWRARIARRLR